MPLYVVRRARLLSSASGCSDLLQGKVGRYKSPTAVRKLLSSTASLFGLMPFPLAAMGYSHTVVLLGEEQSVRPFFSALLPYLPSSTALTPAGVFRFFKPEKIPFIVSSLSTFFLIPPTILTLFSCLLSFVCFPIGSLVSRSQETTAAPRTHDFGSSMNGFDRAPQRSFPRGGPFVIFSLLCLESYLPFSPISTAVTSP